MAHPDCAARDPIFWLHHANIDRLWDRWLDTEGHSNPDDGAWRDRSFRFYDPGRQELRTMTVGEVLDAVDYRYDDEPPPVERPIRRAPVAAEVMAAASADERRTLGSTEPLAVAGRPVLTSGRLAAEAAEMVARADAAAAPQLSLNLEGVQRDEDSPCCSRST
jgi:tyrosinase